MMTDMGVASFLDELASIPPTRNKDDYTKDGILYCGTCGEPKQTWIDWLADDNAGDASLNSRLGRFPGRGHGNPLQYSCLENSMDRGAWWAIVQRVAKSQT